ncbi:4-hydroxy-3-methylbut-2-enyl diphosphate reductase [Nocardia brasiliensis NBRC 14402]|uniref:4-hydroxy-3-methylbut-2-enyl diphosphate reductase n=1 Tax=Nocardia brasiliensis TaxID=37326 RepID=UPI0002D3F0A9|nr:4-hydroxy-3-methylbut-2-enyl diphosphate reductase [Nocardia brasiliensis]ASF12200.1 4-hydroxy-3-methylbut-2-enyl diphosphate reductase [Nocardia brasiliensis]GAJ85887.1 4-hydroxy-3-methylbut-2-enyl diphosphate reductase [Nocardia brasiliensis NBRC 14402]SUB53121.1 4-hydroxy-3-methylbut-2-enyl diphosphate reductase [Nocardia brasiliensis]
MAGTRELTLAAPRSLCAGVERAIDTVESLLAEQGPPIYVRKQIVHNVHVVADLQARGVVFVDDLDMVPEGALVVFSAHGVSPQVRQQATARGLRVVDATCPLVTKVHSEAKRFAAQGKTIILIGHAGHEEVEGTLGEAPHNMVLVQTADEAATVAVPDPTRVVYLTQTTLSVEETAGIIAVLRERFPDAVGPGSSDICYATTNRQAAVQAVAEQSDVVLVVGSANSSNSVRMVELAQRTGTPAHLIEDADHIDPRWLTGARRVGVSAGASAPARLVEDVVSRLSELGPVVVREHTLTTETTRFALPAQARTRRPPGIDGKGVRS